MGSGGARGIGNAVKVMLLGESDEAPDDGKVALALVGLVAWQAKSL